jgi:hypothetical protein
LQKQEVAVVAAVAAEAVADNVGAEKVAHLHKLEVVAAEAVAVAEAGVAADNVEVVLDVGVLDRKLEVVVAVVAAVAAAMADRTVAAVVVAVAAVAAAK